MANIDEGEGNIMTAAYMKYLVTSLLSYIKLNNAGILKLHHLQWQIHIERIRHIRVHLVCSMYWFVFLGLKFIARKF